MSGLIGGSKPPKPQPLPAVPTMDNSAEVRRQEAEERKRRQLAAGSASTVLAGASGAADSYQVSSRKLLGG